MRITPQEPEIPEIGGFTEANDIFGYKPFAERLCNLLRNIEEPLVIALDGPWGSGKSIFAKQWAGLLRESGAPVIAFDAFQNDHYEDAFLALAAEILALATENLGGNETTRRRYLNSAKKVGAVLAPIALRVATRAGTAGLINLEDVQEGGAAFRGAIEALGKEGEKAFEKALSERLRNANQEREVLDSFRETLSNLAIRLGQQRLEENRPFPLVIIIDELDRCRPPFALDLIERIKHLFSVDGVCFVLMTHLPQLEQAIQGAYGTRFDAQTYLEKFYHLRIVLPKHRDQPLRYIRDYVDHLWESLQITFPQEGYNDLVKREIGDLAVIYNLKLRQLERIMTHIALVNAATIRNRLIVPHIIAGLCVMRLIRSSLYEKAKTSSLSWEEAINFLRPNGHLGANDEWTVGLWKYATGAEMTDEEVAQFGRGFAQYHLDDRRRIIPLMAEYIDELIQRRVPAAD